MLIYHQVNNKSAHRLMASINTLMPDALCSVINTLDNSFLLQAIYENSDDVIVFLLEEPTQLEELLKKKDLLLDKKILMILPNLRDETLIKAYQLYPRFTASVDSDFGDIIEVAQKLLGAYRRLKNGETKNDR